VAADLLTNAMHSKFDFSDENSAATWVSQMLLLRAALGRGYASPFPPAKGLVYSSALPSDALRALLDAESAFRAWHEQSLEPLKRELNDLLLAPKQAQEAPQYAEKIRALKDRIARLPHVTWKEDQVLKSALVELLKKSAYGALTYVDPIGARLAGGLTGSPSRFASDLSWLTLTGQSSDETLIRANATGGACIHSLAGSGVAFNHFCACRDEIMDVLVNRLKHSTSGQVALGAAICISGRPGRNALVSSETVSHLLRHVYARGAEHESRGAIPVVFPPSGRAGWDALLAAHTPEALLDDTSDLSDWTKQQMAVATASPGVCAQFGIQAALVSAFLDAAQQSQTSGQQLKAVELTEAHLTLARQAAAFLFRQAAGMHKLQRRLGNLKKAWDEQFEPKRLEAAFAAFSGAVTNAAGGKLPRKAVRDIPDLTLGLLDELVRRGRITELNGTAACQMGKTTRAYALPDRQVEQERDLEEQMLELHEAIEQHKQFPVSDGDAFSVYEKLQRKAEAMDRTEMLPVVPLTRMNSAEIRALPRVMELFADVLYVRGFAGQPELADLTEGDDAPLRSRCPNVWLKYRQDGKPFRSNWALAAKLRLPWTNELPELVPADNQNAI
jgi:hypothetical protein